MAQTALYKVGTSGHAEVQINTPEFNQKYRAWLARRGLTDPSFAAESRAYEKASAHSRRKARR